jgi:malic enzyme
LDANAIRVNYAMARAAALAIADATTEGELLPSLIDPKVYLAVTHSVARAAMDSYVAQRQLDEDYFTNINVKEQPWM